MFSIRRLGMVRSVDVARHLEVHKAQRVPCGGDPAGRWLSDDGRAIYFLHLTDVGREVAEKIYEQPPLLYRAAYRGRR